VTNGIIAARTPNKVLTVQHMDPPGGWPGRFRFAEEPEFLHGGVRNGSADRAMNLVAADVRRLWLLC